MASSQRSLLKRGEEDGLQAHANVGTKTNDGDDGGDGVGGGLGKGRKTKKGSRRGKRPLKEDRGSPTSMTFTMSPGRSPEMVDGPVKPVQSIAIELNELETAKSNEKDQRSVSFVTDPKNGNGGSLSRSLHKSSCIDTVQGFESSKSGKHEVSWYKGDDAGDTSDGVTMSMNEAPDSSDDVAASTRAIKSPYIGKNGNLHGFPFITKSDSGWSDASKTTWSPQLAEEGELGTDSGSSEWSAFDSVIRDHGVRNAGKKEATTEKGLHDNNDIVDSPTLSTGLVARELVIPGRGHFAASKSPISPNPTVNTIATASTTTRAERSLHVPFLPESLWLRGRSLEQNTRFDENGGSASQEPISVFEDETSDEEIRTPTLHTAIRKRFLRPRTVRRGSSSVVVGLKEMLRTTGPERPKNKRGPSKEKLAKLTGEKIWFFQRPNAKRAGVVGLPAPEAGDHQPLPNTAKSRIETPADWGIQQEPARNLPDGLRSHPIRRAATVPTRKRVSFPHPATLDIRPGHRSLRQTVVTTPYPTHSSAFVEGSGSDVHNRREAMVTLVIHNFQTRVPLTKKLVIPSGRAITLEDSSHEKKPNIVATLNSNFDDEKLVKLIKKEYVGLRGVFRSFLSARNVQDVKIFSYSTTSDLVDKIDATHGNPFVSPENRDLGEAQMLGLYRKPSCGRRKHAWLGWIARRPENSTRRASGKQNLALQLVEGWCMWKIASTILALLALSALATLLWIFLGIGGDSLTLSHVNNTSDPGLSTEMQNIQGSHVGFRGAGGRVQTGVLLGTLVLLLGWTGTGAWILLSWLT